MGRLLDSLTLVVDRLDAVAAAAERVGAVSPDLSRFPNPGAVTRGGGGAGRSGATSGGNRPVRGSAGQLRTIEDLEANCRRATRLMLSPSSPAGGPVEVEVGGWECPDGQWYPDPAELDAALNRISSRSAGGATGGGGGGGGGPQSPGARKAADVVDRGSPGARKAADVAERGSPGARNAGARAVSTGEREIVSELREQRRELQGLRQDLRRRDDLGAGDRVRGVV